MDKTAPRKIAPALGISWANLVTVRLMLSRTPHIVPNRSNSEHETSGTPVRAMEVIFAPHLPNSICHYIVDEDGVKGIS